MSYSDSELVVTKDNGVNVCDAYDEEETLPLYDLDKRVEQWFNKSLDEMKRDETLPFCSYNWIEYLVRRHKDNPWHFTLEKIDWVLGERLADSFPYMDAPIDEDLFSKLSANSRLRLAVGRFCFLYDQRVCQLRETDWTCLNTALQDAKEERVVKSATLYLVRMACMQRFEECHHPKEALRLCTLIFNAFPDLKLGTLHVKLEDARDGKCEYVHDSFTGQTYWHNVTALPFHAGGDADSLALLKLLHKHDPDCIDVSRLYISKTAQQFVESLCAEQCETERRYEQCETECRSEQRDREYWFHCPVGIHGVESPKGPQKNTRVKRKDAAAI